MARLCDTPELMVCLTRVVDSRLHVLIQDSKHERYQVPEDIFPRPSASSESSKEDSHLDFDFKTSPFSFEVKRSSTNEVLFSVSSEDFSFESQHLRLRTSLPKDPNIYGLGEHFDSFRMPNEDYKRTLWGADGGVGYRQNLYGSHPVYFEHRTTGTHGVFLLNSNGMDINLDRDAEEQNYLEYNVLGGIFDFYFVAGPEPVDVARQYAEIAGLPAMIPYWTLGVRLSPSILVADIGSN